jgi:hypothetical protein
LDACEQPTDYTTDDADCDDSDADINPDATEICGNGIDEDCDGVDDVCPVEELLLDNDFEASVDDADLRDNAVEQDWYESRNDIPTQITLDETEVAGNIGKKAKFTGSTSGNAYLSQEFSTPQTGQFSLEWDIYMVEIVSGFKSGWMFVGDDANNKDGPSSTGGDRFMRMSFANAGPGKMDLVARHGTGSTDVVVVSDLNLNQWYHIRVDIDVDADTYTVYVDGEEKGTYGAQTLKSAVTHISFATWNDGPGTFYIDNVETV